VVMCRWCGNGCGDVDMGVMLWMLRDAVGWWRGEVRINFLRTCRYGTEILINVQKLCVDIAIQYNASNSITTC
jgi:hypothetical protein